jgi:hypothetical protein
MRKPALVAIWLLATLATSAVAYVAVTAAGAEVTDGPLTSLVVARDDEGSGPTTTGAISTTTAGPGTTGSATSLTLPAIVETTPSTATTAAPTSTTAAPGTSTTSPTSTSVAVWQQTTIPSRGGLVVVSHRPGEVILESVAPAAGFAYEIDDEGPPEARVEFEGDGVRVEVRARWENGLVVEIDEDS